MSDLPPIPLPEGIRSRFVENNNGLRMHVLEAGEERAPCLLLLHGFPELAFSWRKIMVPLAQAGFHVVAPDQRGYGRTTGWDPDYDGDLGSYRMTNLVTDAVGLVFALGHRTVRAVIGHDFGSPVAAYAALVRPDVFESVALMSAPFAGPPSLSIGQLSTLATADNVHRELAALPRARKHYQWYYTSREANDHIVYCAQGLQAFLRAYYHQKSADWPGNKPHPLKAWTADELAKLPTYYVMDLHETMAQTVAHEMPSAEQIATCEWVPDSELEVYAREFQRTGFQGGLQWYRCAISPRFSTELALFSGRTIDVPSVFISGASDWGHYQRPGALEAMQSAACTRWRGCHFVAGAGHWVQQEQPEPVASLLMDFLRSSASL